MVSSHSKESVNKQASLVNSDDTFFFFFTPVGWHFMWLGNGFGRNREQRHILNTNPGLARTADTKNTKSSWMTVWEFWTV